MINVGIIGCGYWGPNYVRIINDLKEAKVKYCCDLEQKNLINIKKIYQEVKVSTDYKNILRDASLDAIIITTPLNSHYEIVKVCLERGKHVLVEKPFTSSSREAGELIEIAQKNHLVLHVGHVYKYNPGIQKLKMIIKKKELGSLYYLYAQRLGLGPIRKYANVLWDLATHDIFIALYLLDDFPIKVTAVGEHYIQHDIKDLVFVSLHFSSRIICNICATWIAPEKIRKISVVGSRGMAVFDDVNKSEMLKVYERKVNTELLDSNPEYSDHQLVVSIGDVYFPQIEQSEPLKNQAKHFLECISGKKRPLSDAYEGLNVVRILEAAEKSLKSRKTVSLKYR